MEQFRERMSCLELDCVRLLGDLPYGLAGIIDWLSWATDDDLRGFMERMRKEHGSPWDGDITWEEDEEDIPSEEESKS